MNIFIICSIATLIGFGSACRAYENETRCHPTCLSCSDNARCNDTTKCTNCHHGHYRLLNNKKDIAFKCLPNCTNIPSYAITKDNFVCDIQNLHKSTIIVHATTEKPITTSSQFSYHDYSFFLILFFLFIILFLAVLFLCCAFKRRQITQVHQRKRMDIERGLIKHVNKEASEEIMLFKSLDIITNPDEIIRNEVIGQGSFSTVYEGIWKDNLVAIKVAFAKGRKSLHKELQIYEKVVSHSSIVPALGVHLGLENMLILALRKYNLTKYFVNFGNTLGFRQLKQYCIQLADGMRYLHSKNIIHCDLKIDNILVKDDNGETIEISDFGCAIDLKSDYNPVVMGTLTHQAYELLKANYPPSHENVMASKACDVWSFGVTVWQIFSKTNNLPKNFQHLKQITQNYEKGIMLPQPSLIPPQLWRHIIFPCFNIDPTARPLMNDLYNNFLRQQIVLVEEATSTSVD